MRRLAPAAALLVALTACNGDKKPQATPSAPVSHAPPSALALTLREQVTKTLNACPCGVLVRLRGTGEKGAFGVNLKGSYDAKAHAALLQNETGSAISLVAVDGRTYIATLETRALGATWMELDLSKTPEKAKVETPLTLLDVADPTIGLALAQAVTGDPKATSPSGPTPQRYVVEFDLNVAAPKAGLAAENLRAAVPEALARGALTFDEKHHLVHVEMRAAGAKGSTESTVAAEVWITGQGVAMQPVVAPGFKGTIEANEGFPRRRV
ncbi:MAG TPA: hypothetical protein VFQ85_02215 [Mycobacteriales bacterium]|jgi:hypothetical protein|nr:hypothetical protein [Mycobacteriales bacterium]